MGALWRMAMDEVTSDPEAGSEDYEILYEQFQRCAIGSASGLPLEAPGNSAQDRLVHHANRRHASKMAHRMTCLSKDEASAAAKLAASLAALGGDEFGTYSDMARAVGHRPGHQLMGHAGSRSRSGRESEQGELATFAESDEDEN